MAMRRRSYPGTDLTVSEVGFGVWTVTTGWWPDAQRQTQQGLRLLRLAHELGITLFDTADVYGDGLGETLLRAALGAHRDELVIATKGGYDLTRPGPGGQREREQDFSPGYLRYAIEQSLTRLGTDRIDLYQLHNVKLDHVLADDLAATLDDLVAAGKLRAWGTALGPAIGFVVEGTLAIRRGLGCSQQIIYNALEQNPGRALFAEARRAGQMGFLVRVPHSSGLLEGKYTLATTFPPHDHRRHRPRSWLVNGLEKVRQLEFLTAGGARTLGQAALKFVLAEPQVMSCLPNIYDEDQLREFAAAPATPDLTTDELERLAALYAVNFGLDEPPMGFKGLDPTSVRARELLGAGARVTA